MLLYRKFGFMVNVAIVEDNIEILESLKILINGTSGYTCTISYSNAEEAIKELPLKMPDVVLMDIDLPKKSGIDAVREIKKSTNEIQFIMLTVNESDDHIFNALRAGASGYLTKNTSPAKILSAIEDVMDGGAPMSSSIARLVVDSFNKQQVSEDYGLSLREKEVLDYLCQGKNYKYIAEKLFISGETVRKHNRNIYKKLEVNSKSEAVAKAFKNNIL